MIEVFVIDAKEVATKAAARILGTRERSVLLDEVEKVIADEIAKAQEPPKTESVGEAVARRMFDHTLRLTDVGFIDHDACGSPLLKWFRIDRTQFPASCPYIQDAGELLKELRRVVAKAIDAERADAKKEEREAVLKIVEDEVDALHGDPWAYPKKLTALIRSRK